ncbi:MAG: hypothetical protein KF754_15810 [Planctomycetes bacterium]|nr:hypothetical protein [Planctomycetota bacterium]
MIAALQAYAAWCGEWIGTGESENGAQVKVRLWLDSAMHGEILRMRLEVNLPGALSPGIAALGMIGVDPESRLRMGLWSSLSGNFVLDQLPDDADVLALAGRTPRGSDLTLSLLAVDERLQINWLWRKAGETEGTRLSASLARLQPIAIGG